MNLNKRINLFRVYLNKIPYSDYLTVSQIMVKHEYQHLISDSPAECAVSVQCAVSYFCQLSLNTKMY